MIIMALDHVRDYFHADAFLYDPTDLSKTTAFLFFTRWITHFCAPVFMFLSGTSAFLVGERKGKKYLSRFLLTRGLWLIFLELTVINFGWFFNIHFTMIDFIVIWALGVSMIALAGLIYLPVPAIVTISMVMVFGHNFLDNVHVAGNGSGAFIWSMLHEARFFNYGDHIFFVGYPVIPWIGVMALGYCIGTKYTANYDPVKRKRFLVELGAVAIALFAVLRLSNAYGDPNKWSGQASGTFTFLSFLNVSKYPPSFLYLLVTLGPRNFVPCICREHKKLAFPANKNDWPRTNVLLSRAHLHYSSSCARATYFCGHTWKDMILTDWVSFEPKLQGYGFSLGVVYAIWFSVIVILYFLCRWYDGYKRSHIRQKWWLSYL
jgi:uncharacterized membrane protein